MKQLLLFSFLFIPLYHGLFSQEEDSLKASESYLPLDCLTEKIYIEKYEPITSYEVACAINKRENSSMRDSINGKTQIIQGADFFNLILYRKINNEITALTNSINDPLIEAIHKRDRKENVDGNYRFLIRSDFNFTSFDEKKMVNPGYYLYDQETKTKYRTYPTVESLLSAITLARKHSPWKDQDKLNDYLAPRNRKDYQRFFSAQRESDFSSVVYVLIITAIITLATIF